MSAFIEMLPPDRPIFMTGQPIMRLVPSGGPGGSLGDLLERAVVSLAGRKGAPPPPPPPAPPPAPPLPAYQPMTPAAMSTSAQAQVVQAPTTSNAYVQLPAAPAPSPTPSPWASPSAQSSPWSTPTPASSSPWSTPAASQSQAQWAQAQPYSQYQQQQAAWDEAYGPDDDEDAMSGVNGAFVSPSDLAQIDSALQAQLTAVAEGQAPDVSAEYFKPTNVPGLRQNQEGPHTGREGVYPKKLRDMVEFDFMGNNAYVSMNDLAGLGCCGEENMGYMGDAPAAQAQALDGKCDGIEATIKLIVDSVQKAQDDKSLSVAQKRAVAQQARAQIKGLKQTWRACISRLKQVAKSFRKELKAAGLSGIEAKVDGKIQVERVRQRLAAAGNPGRHLGWNRGRGHGR